MRFGSFLIIVFLAFPMMFDCCLPAAETLPCHESTQMDDQTCITHRVAIVEMKNKLAAKSTVEYRVPMTLGYSGQFAPTGHSTERVAFAHNHATDICLRTGALLI
jgi:hypothetical protein